MQYFQYRFIFSLSFKKYLDKSQQLANSCDNDFIPCIFLVNLEKLGTSVGTMRSSIQTNNLSFWNIVLDFISFQLFSSLHLEESELIYLCGCCWIVLSEYSIFSCTQKELGGSGSLALNSQCHMVE